MADGEEDIFGAAESHILQQPLHGGREEVEVLGDGQATRRNDGQCFEITVTQLKEKKEREKHGGTKRKRREEERREGKWRGKENLLEVKEGRDTVKGRREERTERHAREKERRKNADARRQTSKQGQPNSTQWGAEGLGNEENGSKIENRTDKRNRKKSMDNQLNIIIIIITVTRIMPLSSYRLEAEYEIIPCITEDITQPRLFIFPAIPPQFMYFARNIGSGEGCCKWVADPSSHALHALENVHEGDEGEGADVVGVNAGTPTIGQQEETITLDKRELNKPGENKRREKEQRRGTESK